MSTLKTKNMESEENILLKALEKMPAKFSSKAFCKKLKLMGHGHLTRNGKSFEFLKENCNPSQDGSNRSWIKKTKVFSLNEINTDKEILKNYLKKLYEKGLEKDAHLKKARECEAEEDSIVAMIKSLNQKQLSISNY
jgi:hypothetical protein